MLDNPSIIIGPPGTGKTTTLIGMVEEELGAGTPPDRIGYVSFTRKAAIEAQSRARAKFGLTKRDLPWFRTLHSLCMHWMGLSSGMIMEAARLQEFSDVVGERITGRFSVEDGSYSGYDRGDRMLFMDNLARVRRVPLRQQYEEDHDNIDWAVIDRFSRTLAEFKKSQSLIDYTDMLDMFVNQGTAPPLEALFVDESQDLSYLQWLVVFVLARGCRRVVVAGDDDQAIYRWAGADVDTFVNMKGEVTVLGQSWRVPRSVQTFSNGIISSVKNRRPKLWSPRDEEGSVRHLAALEQVEWTAPSTLVLARNQFLLERVMDELRSSGILWEHHGHPSVSQRYLDGIVAWETCRRGEKVSVERMRKAYALMSIGTGVKRGFKTLPRLPPESEYTLEEYKQWGGLLRDDIWHDALDLIPAAERAYMIRCRRRGERFSVPPRVVLSTIHGAKGGEADTVVLLSDMAARTQEEAHRHPEDESRVWYVGATRALRELLVVAPWTSRYVEL